MNKPPFFITFAAMELNHMEKKIWEQEDELERKHQEITKLDADLQSRRSSSEQ